MMSITLVIRTVAARYRLRPEEVTSKRRVARQVRPRHVAMYLARELTTASYPEIARHFRCDHTTVLSAVKRILKLRSEDVAIATAISGLIDELATLAEPDKPRPLVDACPHCRRLYIEPDRRIEALADVRAEIQKLSDKVELLERVA